MHLEVRVGQRWSGDEPRKVWELASGHAERDGMDGVGSAYMRDTTSSTEPVRIQEALVSSRL